MKLASTAPTPITPADAPGYDVLLLPPGLHVALNQLLPAVVIAAAGNNWFSATCNPGGNNKTSYPGASAGVIGVGAVEASFIRSCFSNVGSYVDVAAPG